MISLNKLTDIYNKWGDKNNLQPLESADAELLRNDLTVNQYAFLIQFLKVWDMTEKKIKGRNDAKIYNRRNSRCH